MLQLKAFPSGPFREADISHRYATTQEVVSARHNTTVLLGFFLRVQGMRRRGTRKKEGKGVRAGEGNYTSSLETKGFKLI